MPSEEFLAARARHLASLGKPAPPPVTPRPEPIFEEVNDAPEHLRGAAYWDWLDQHPHVRERLFEEHAA